MPVLRKATPKPGAPAKKPVPKEPELSLPDDFSEPSDNFFDYSWLIYGERKIGKTSLLQMFDGHFFLMFEKGAKGLRTRRRYVENWNEFNKYLDLLESNPSYSKMNIIDTGGECYEQCLIQTKADLQLEDIRDKAWGGGYVEIRQRFALAHERLFRLPAGFAVTAHSEVKTIKPKWGAEYDKISIQLSGQAFKYYAGVVDTIAYYHYDDNGNRILTIRGDETVEAGTRCEGHFLYPDGTPIKDIPMGNSKEEAYANLVSAFNNELPKPRESRPSAGVAVRKKTP